MPFWKAGKNDDQVLDELKETQKQNADEFVKKQEHADEAQKSSLIIDNNFTPVEYDPQYILQVNHLKKYFPIKYGVEDGRLCQGRRRRHVQLKARHDDGPCR